jgi:Yeast cortical protein KAR9
MATIPSRTSSSTVVASKQRSPDKRQPMLETQSQFDLHQLLVPTSSDGPPVPRKDSERSPSRTPSDAESYFIPDSLSRTTSVFSFSRASFSQQLASLTSMKLPQAESLATSIGALPSASKAVKALSAAAQQIQQWTKKALKVLKDLDADDDVEWAAAAGRNGLDDMDKTVNKFETLISVYVLAIEELQTRPDIGEIKSEELQNVVEQMEVVLEGWDNVRKGLKAIHDQVELAMEWEELWTTVLGDVGAELDSLSNLVFEMEEKRHTALFEHKNESTAVDLNELESIIQEPAKTTTPNNRFSLVPMFESSPLGSPVVENSQDDSNLLALFARMQPLRASLDFLPMRLSMFQARAAKIFPQACEELEDKKDRLEKNWQQLSKEAETLRRELSEDRWVVVFRTAGRQAQKMMDSIERSVEKLSEAIEHGYQRNQPVAFAKRVEGFEAKRLHYGPAIQRVIQIISKGLGDRLTVNGEIVRLHKDISSKARAMSELMDDMESILENVNPKQNSRLRESMSSIQSTDRSFSSTTFVDTPHSSPASSVDLSAQRPTPKYGMNGYSRPRAPSQTRPPLSLSSRRSSIQPRTPSSMHSHSIPHVPRRSASPSPGVSSVYRQGVYQPPTATLPVRPSPNPTKPRWSAVAKTADPVPLPGHGSRSSSLSTVSPFNRTTPRSISRSSNLPYPSPLSRETSASPSQIPTPATARRGSQQFRSFAERVASPSPPRNGGIMDPVPYHRGRNITAPVPGTIRSPSSTYKANSRPTTSSTTTSGHGIRPPSAVSHTYTPRQSMPLRQSSERPRPSHRSEDSAIDLDADNLENEEEQAEMLDELESSPTIRPAAPGRPMSSMAISGKGKRMSMLPVPARVSSGRGSSLGHRV